jgi:quercetin dioxygenase-like cupin family protein
MNPKPRPLRKRRMDLTPTHAPAERAIKRRLLERVADADESHTTLAPDSRAWQPFLPGVQLCVLHEADGVLSYLLRLAPGAGLPPHRHELDEECIVLEGTLRVGTHTVVPAGGYHLAHRGALHPTVHTATGATIFLRGAVPKADDVLA